MLDGKTGTFLSPQMKKKSLLFVLFLFIFFALNCQRQFCLRPLVSSKAFLTSWGEGTSLALVATLLVIVSR